MGTSEESMEPVAAKAPVAAKRKLNLHLQEHLPKPYLPRALVAVNPECMNGSKGHHHNNMSVLQQHVLFLDRNNDGKLVYLWETYKGLWRSEICPKICIFLFRLTKLSMYDPTQGWILSLLFPIHIHNIH
eukprot:Gb_07338 [translate_table: standard]